METKKEQLIEAINDLLKLIDKTNESISLHKQIHADVPLMYEQYERLKDDYLRQLAKLLNAFDVIVQLPDQAA